MSSVRSVRYVWCALLAGLLAALTLAGCGGSGSESTSSDGPAAKAARPAEAGDVQAGGSAAGTGKSRAPAQPAQPVKLDPNGANRSVVYTADLKVRAKNVDEAATRAKQLVTAAGGYVENESAAGDAGRATLTVKIPADRYTGMLEQLTGQLGTKLGLRQQAEDVTEEVADVDSRVRSAQATLASFRKLLDRARTVGEVINVEQEISQRQAELEALQARQKSLAHRTRYATVTLELSGPVKQAAKPKDDDEGGFVGGLKQGWKAFVAFVSGLALVVGVLLPFLIVAAMIAVPAFYVRRQLIARRTPPPAVSPPASE